MKVRRCNRAAAKSTTETQRHRWAQRVISASLCLCGLVAPLRSIAQPTTWNQSGINGGGAMFSPAYSPHNSNEMYLSCDVGGLFRSTSLGASWSHVDYHQIIGNRGSLVQFTSDPNILYALDFTSNAGSDQTRPSKSTNGGSTWTPIGSDPTFGGAYALYADPGNTTSVLVTDYSTLYYSSNGGTSWSSKYTTGGGNGLYVAGAFFDGTNIYVGTNLGLLVSNNGGSTFALAGVGGIGAGQAMVSMCGAKQGSTVRLFCVAWNSADVYPGVFVEGSYTSSFMSVYKLDIGQANWSAVNTGLTANDYPILCAMARNDITTAYMGGGSSTSDPRVWKWTQAGNSWANTFLTTNNQNITTGYCGYNGDLVWSFPEVALGLGVDPLNSLRVAFSDFGFAHMTTDGGTNWTPLYCPVADRNPAGSATPKGRSYGGIGLEVTACWDLCWATASTIIGAMTDIHVIRSTDGGTKWSQFYGSPTLNTLYRTVKHPTTGTLYAATSSVHDMYQSTRVTDSTIDGGSGRVLYSSDNGATWQTLHDFGHGVVWVALDPTNANRLYASVAHSTLGGIYVSSNIQNGASSTWSKLTNPPRTEGHPLTIVVLNDGTLVCSYSARRTGSPLAFSASSGVFVSTNSGTSWTDRTDANMQYWTKDLVIDPHDSSQNTWYAAVFSGYGGTGTSNNKGGLYRTTNRGVNWTKITGLMNVESCTVSPTNTNEAYLTTELDGLWYCSNLRVSLPSLPTFSALSTYLFSHPMRVFYDPNNSSKIWVASFGNGIRTGTAPVAGVSVSEWMAE